MDDKKFAPRAAAYHAALAFAILCALLVLAPNLIRIPYRLSITYNEGWNLYHGMQVADGAPLYDPTKPLIPVNYPPLYFYLEAVLRALPMDLLQAGRWISAASLLLLAVLAGRAVRSLGGRWPDAVLAATLFAGYAGAYVPQYVGMNDPQLLAHVLVFGGLLVLLQDRTRTARLLAAACLMALGLFVKHNLLAVPVAAAAGLLLESRRGLALFLGFFASVILILTLGTLRAAGADFLHQIFLPRTLSISKLAEDSRHFLTFMALPLVAAAFWMKKHSFTNPARYFTLYLVFSLAVGMAAASGFGTAGNMFLDACLALAVISGLFLADFRAAVSQRGLAPWLPALAVAALAGNFLLEAPGNLKGLLNGTTVAHLHQREKAFLEDVSYVAHQPGPALCETLTLCYYAGKPMELDPFNVSQEIVAGALNEEPVVDLIRSGRFRTIQFKGQRMPDRAGIVRSTAAEMFPDTFLTTNTIAAVIDRYDLKRKTQTGMFYTPR